MNDKEFQSFLTPLWKEGLGVCYGKLTHPFIPSF